MTLGFDFHPEARAELFADVDWYDEREPGVGERFEGAVRAAIDAAVDSPESWTVWPGWEREPVVRSKGVTDFPYRVVYFVRDDLLLIVAVAHAKTSAWLLARASCLDLSWQTRGKHGGRHSGGRGPRLVLSRRPQVCVGALRRCGGGVAHRPLDGDHVAPGGDQSAGEVVPQLVLRGRADRRF